MQLKSMYHGNCLGSLLWPELIPIHCGEVALVLLGAVERV